MASDSTSTQMQMIEGQTHGLGMRRRSSFRETLIAVMGPATSEEQTSNVDHGETWKGQDSDFSEPHSPPTIREPQTLEQAREEPYWW